MANEQKNKSIGEVKIAADVVAAIAGLAATEVDGVYAMAGTLTNELAGMLIYEGETKCSGGSGCGCSAVVLGSCIMDRLIRGEYKRVLFVPTGALLSTVSYNEGKSVPGIAHGVILEGKES